MRPCAGEVRGGAVEEIDTSDWSVLDSVTLSDGVDSDVSSDVELC